ncbi:unnamed protein product [Caenorhabditis angaria]|uniref:Uncharacterized protein n=1 Tax=Caenorhabditis angaria TaxID=860376 RepID=A0A9P1J4E1_9PELO|nr:unnamed protein product [Caenorhabditis angaria]
MDCNYPTTFPYINARPISNDDDVQIIEEKETKCLFERLLIKNSPSNSIEQVICYKKLLFYWKPDCAALRVLANIKKPVDEIRLALFKEFSEDILKQPQIYQVSKTLSLDRLHLTNQQFRQLSAKNVSMLIGNLTEQNIVDFLKSFF